MFKREAKEIFLGGTCNGSKWRDYFIPRCKMSYFNPVVQNWTEESMAEEEWHMVNDKYLLWVITPKQTGYLSPAEAVDLAHRYHSKLIFTVWEDEPDCSFTDHQRQSLNKVKDIVEKAGGRVFYKLDDVIDYLR